MQGLKRYRKIFSILIIILGIPAVILAGTAIFNDRKYAFISVMVTVLSVAAFFISFERKSGSTLMLTLIAAMTALSSVGRIAFTFLPGFKPVAAIVIISGIYLKSQAGFLTGALSALISNFAFGQGAWTPFQMLSWGLIGFFAGVLAEHLKKSRILLIIFAILSGLFYSLVMDAWPVLFSDEVFNFSRYFGFLASSSLVMIEYCVSNVIFLLLFIKPIGGILQRIVKKYGLVE